jgi:DNA-binding transcriptional ArsR family regulator
MKMTFESENVLKALSSTTRRTIMRQISEKGSATYTEIMHVLDLDPSLMSGKFNYHLKELQDVGLIEKMNGEYRITDLGKRALILVDQVAKDVKIDQYGVLSAVMTMSPRKEMSLFLNQNGMIAGSMVAILSIIPLVLNYGVWDIISWISLATTIVGFVIFIVSSAKMVGIIRKYKLGISSMVFLSSNWFFIRSPNRNNFLIITMFTVGFFVSLCLGFILPYVGEMEWFSLQWIGLIISSISSGLLSLVFLNRANRKAKRLEEISNEQ